MSKDWTGNDTSVYKMLGASNHTKDERQEDDYYATDPKAIDELLKYETFKHEIWEPACGEGHLSNRLEYYGYDVFSSDLVDRGYEGLNATWDFLKGFDGKTGVYETSRDIITNPPYKYCTEFILQALDAVREGGKIAMFLKLTTLESQKRYDLIFSKNPPKAIYVFVKRIECAKNAEFKGTSAVCYAWFVWEKGFKGDPIIKWIN